MPSWYSTAGPHSLIGYIESCIAGSVQELYEGSEKLKSEARWDSDEHFEEVSDRFLKCRTSAYVLRGVVEFEQAYTSRKGVETCSTVTAIQFRDFALELEEEGLLTPQLKLGYLGELVALEVKECIISKLATMSLSIPSNRTWLDRFHFAYHATVSAKDAEHARIQRIKILNSDVLGVPRVVRPRSTYLSTVGSSRNTFRPTESFDTRQSSSFPLASLLQAASREGSAEPRFKEEPYSDDDISPPGCNARPSGELAIYHRPLVTKPGRHKLPFWK